MNIKFKGQNFLLHSKKGLFWKEQSLLIIADLHLGKIAHFRKSGVGLPAKAMAKDLQNLSELLKELKPRNVLFLGDLFHSDYNMEWESFTKLLLQFPDISFQLLFGNHDILPKKYYAAANLVLHTQQLQLGPFLFTHEPTDIKTDDYQISGHIHPGVRLKGNGLGSLTIPCFYFSQKQAILPAFGYFTGLYKIQPQKSDLIFGVVEEKVIKLQ